MYIAGLKVPSSDGCTYFIQYEVIFASGAGNSHVILSVRYCMIVSGSSEGYVGLSSLFTTEGSEAAAFAILLRQSCNVFSSRLKSSFGDLSDPVWSHSRCT